MKRLLIILICCLFYTVTFSAQNSLSLSSDSTKETKGTKEMNLHMASSILQRVYNEHRREAALKIVKSHLKAEEPEAMHVMGMVYYSGLSVKRDLDSARIYFEKANNKGYLKSAYNLAMLYRLGIGVKQDFTKAYQYLCRAGEDGQAQAVYARGYMQYKGLGCTQSYEEALKYFHQAADKGHGYSMYMIGLCFRNGYGVERDKGEANFWLKKASDRNIKTSDMELSIDSPENPIQPIKMSSAVSKVETAYAQTVRFRKIRHQISSSRQLKGNYSGSLSTFDWSGQYVIKESPLEIYIEQNGNQIIARWKEDTLATVVAKGVLTDTALVFTEATYSKRDHYNGSKPAVWDFLLATLQLVTDSNSVTLAGSLQLYSPDTKEPEKPMYLSIRSKPVSTKRSKVAAAEVSPSEPTAELITDPMVYPNPFSNLLNISFYLEEKATCSVSIFSMSGSKVYEESLGKLNNGIQHFQLNLNLISGNYSVKLSYGDKVFRSVIIKK